jgi:hypothetical protein
MTKAKISSGLKKSQFKSSDFPTKKEIAKAKEVLKGSELTRWYVRLFERNTNLKEGTNGS